MDVFGNVCIVAIVMQMSTNPTPKRTDTKYTATKERWKTETTKVYRHNSVCLPCVCVCLYVQLVANGKKEIFISIFRNLVSCLHSWRSFLVAVVVVVNHPSGNKRKRRGFSFSSSSSSFSVVESVSHCVTRLRPTAFGCVTTARVPPLCILR